jgi:para-aminobenzoate synthetase/4-amino-4-deoxychorismate lyase
MTDGMPVEIWLDDVGSGKGCIKRFSRAISVVVAETEQEVRAAFSAIEASRAAGRYLAGYFAYELGYVLEPRLRPFLPSNRDVPLLWFGVFDDCETLEGEAATDFLNSHLEDRVYTGPLRHEWQQNEYTAKFHKTRDLIEAGDIYQTNLSFRSRFASIGDAATLYVRLREHSQVAHGAYLHDGKRHILSLSPELFFSISSDGKMVAKPMKGTAPRSMDSIEDDNFRRTLQNSIKDRAENLMIVDLLRNDLGRVGVTGSVSVEDLFTVESYPTVHQMVSTVRTQMKPGVSVDELMRALFPCGSVTGAPKIRAMEVIRDLEESPRGIYCGAIGYFAPDGTASFNVAIRTITISGDRGELGIGGAIVHDSDAASEYNECLLKGRYFEASRKPIELLETLRFSPNEGFTRLELHLDRMQRSADAFSIPFDASRARAVLSKCVAGLRSELRVRLVLSEEGEFSCTASDLLPNKELWRFAISEAGVSSQNVLLHHKTSWREFYDAALDSYPACDEVVFLNEHGRLTEGCRTNLFLRRGELLVTPKEKDGLLPGCLRRELIDRGLCEESEIYPDDLRTADDVFLGNSLRGLIRAVLVQP